MNFLDKQRFSVKLGIMTGAAVCGLAIFAVIAFQTLRAVRINSPRYQDIALAYQLAGDCYDPPASVVAALPPAIGAEESSSPEETRKFVELLRADAQAFETSHQHYQQVLPPGPIRDLMRDYAYPTGHQWYQIAEQQYIPALLAGDLAGARKIRIERMNPVFTRHKEANDKLAELTASWIPSEEKNAEKIIHTRFILLTIIAVVLASLLFFLGSAISRGMCPCEQRHGWRVWVA